jgi:GNAT superfamily N-acetyltransferase
MNKKSTEVKAEFRAAREEDVPRLQSFMNELYSEDPNIADKPRPDIGRTFRELSAHPDKGQLVALCADGVPCGYAILIFFWSNEYGTNVIEIDEVYVDESHRGCGIGGKFFSWLRSTFADSSAGWTLQVAHKNEAARKLYERLGFKQSRNEHMICIFAEQQHS